MCRLLPYSAVCLSLGFFAACSSGAPAGGSGGASHTGGASASSGGAPGSGGSASGGATGSGGSASGGGTGSGGSASGGSVGSGGSATGGAAATGGRGAGGASETGGGAGRASSGGAGGGAGGSGTGGSTPGVDGGATDGPARPMRVLLYSFSTLDIATVPAQLTYLKQKLEGWGYTVDQSKDPTVFTDTGLAKYAAVGMINTCFFPFGANNMGAAESQALQKFLKAGGGLFGTHCADVTFQSVNPPPLYNQLIGGRADSSNFDGDSTCTKMGDHPTIAGLPATFTYKGNLDNAGFVATDSTVLVRCKWSGGGQKDTAVSWVRTEGGAGRVFFTNFAKVDADLKDPSLGDKHIIPGLAWVLGR